MQTRPLGQSGIEASVIGFGAWVTGGWMWGGVDDSESVGAIHAAIDHGITLIDTAPVYGYGHSEQVVGRALKGKRDKVVLATKCGLRWDMDPPKGEYHFSADEDGWQEKGSDAAKYDIYKYSGPEGIREEIESSLQRLGTDYIDLYQTHWQDSTTPSEDTMAELMKLKDGGKIRAIGVSNATVDHVKAYQNVGPVDSMQEKYSMLDRRLEDNGTLRFTAEVGIAVLAYSPLANGLLTGKITPDRKFNEGDIRSWRPRFSVENRQRVADFLALIQPIADNKGLTLTQLVLAWTVAQAGLTHALVGGRTEQQVKENAAAGQVVLSDGELKAIRDAVAQGTAGIE